MTEAESVSSDRQLHYFLVELLACDMDYIDNYEDIIVDVEDAEISPQCQNYMVKIQGCRSFLPSLAIRCLFLQALG